MGAPDLLEQLRAVGVRLWVEGGALVAEPRRALTDDLRAAIRAHKPELLAALQATETKRSSLAVVRLRLLMEAEDGRRYEAILAVPKATFLVSTKSHTYESDLQVPRIVLFLQ